MVRPQKPVASRPLDGTEKFFVIQDERFRVASIEMVRNFALANLLLGEKNRKAEFIETTAGTEYTFKQDYSNPPIIIPIPTWSGNQRVEPTVLGSITKEKLTLGAKQTRGTLLLNSTPYEDARSGTAIRAIAVEI